MMWIHVLFLSLLLALLPDKATAKIYTCEGDNGRNILTDQPKGKRGCTLLETPSPSPPGGFTPPIEPSPPEQSEALSPPTPPASPTGKVPGQSASTDHPPSPDGSRGEGEKAAPEAQRCSPRVNPLNPFAGMNCPPAAGNTPDETQKP